MKKLCSVFSLLLLVCLLLPAAVNASEELPVHSLQDLFPSAEKSGTAENSDARTLPGLFGNRNSQQKQETDVPKRPSFQSTHDAFLLVGMTMIYGNVLTQENSIEPSSAYLVRAGEDLTLGSSYTALTLTFLETDSDYVVFTTSRGDLMAGGNPTEDGVYVLKKGEVMTLWDRGMADAEAGYSFSLADVTIERATDPMSFSWDADQDGTEERAFFYLIDNGDEALSYCSFTLTDAADAEKTWGLDFEGIYEIQDVRWIHGPADNFLIVDALMGDFYSHDTETSFVIIFEDNDLSAVF